MEGSGRSNPLMGILLSGFHQIAWEDQNIATQRSKLMSESLIQRKNIGDTMNWRFWSDAKRFRISSGRFLLFSRRSSLISEWIIRPLSMWQILCIRRTDRQWLRMWSLPSQRKSLSMSSKRNCCSRSFHPLSSKKPSMHIIHDRQAGQTYDYQISAFWMPMFNFIKGDFTGLGDGAELEENIKNVAFDILLQQTRKFSNPVNFLDHQERVWYDSMISVLKHHYMKAVKAGETLEKESMLAFVRRNMQISFFV